MKLEPIRSGVVKTQQIDPAGLGRRVFIYIDISSVDKDRKTITSPTTLSITEAPSRARKRICTHDVLVSTVRPSLNGVALVPQSYDGEIASTGFCVLRADQRILNPYYLFYCTQTTTFIERLAKLSIGAGYPAVTDDDILDTLIPLLPLPEQQRIAAILTKADRLRRLRRYALELGESYLQSVFLEMFGDPATNPKGWEFATISDLGKVTTGNTPSRAHPEYYGDYIEWTKSDNIPADEMWITKSTEMLSREGLVQGRSVEPGSLLVTCIAGSLSSIGNAALTNRRVTFNQQINSISPFHDVDSYFLYSLVKLAKPILQETATDGMKHLLSKSNFEAIKLFKPPRSLQRQFATIAKRSERLRSQQREAARQAEHLFQTLLHRAFAGEL